MKIFRLYMLVTGLAMVIMIISPLSGISQVISDPGCDPLDPACPIDGGLSLLIAAGISIGAKRAYDLKKKQQKENI